MKYDLSNWPAVDLNKVQIAFRQVPLEAYPELAQYDRTAIHEALAGQGGLFLASDMAKLLSLRRGMRVLDLGCGAGITSLFMARTFGAQIHAVDAELPLDLVERASRAGVSDLVIPVRADARNLPFDPGFFDAIFCMNAFFYFGTDDLYPPYLLGFLKEAGDIAIGSPCYREELSPDTPEELLLEFPDCLAVHSPPWWRQHFEKTRGVEVLHSALHPRGVEFWEDRVRQLLEQNRTGDMKPSRRNMIYHIIRMLNRDTDGMVSHFLFHARKRTPNKPSISPT
jgi:SAM-dependent methyltransferase